MMGARGSINIAISETDVGMDKEIVQADTQQRVNYQATFIFEGI